MFWGKEILLDLLQIAYLSTKQLWKRWVPIMGGNGDYKHFFLQ